MNYREKIRKAIECPQFNNTRYGEWGALNLEQRRYIKRLLDELDSADNYIKKLYFENQKQKEVIDKIFSRITLLKMEDISKESNKVLDELTSQVKRKLRKNDITILYPIFGIPLFSILEIVETEVPNSITFV